MSVSGQPRTILSYRKELNLTDKQEKDLGDTLNAFQKYLGEKRNELMALQGQLGEMLKKKENMKNVRKELEKMAAIQVDLSCMDIETSRKIESILTPAQIDMWKGMQVEYQKKMQEQMKQSAQAQQQK
jgi:Spy/CpxP family protein refolding chaperone